MCHKLKFHPTIAGRSAKSEERIEELSDGCSFEAFELNPPTHRLQRIHEEEPSPILPSLNAEFENHRSGKRSHDDRRLLEEWLDGNSE